MSALASEADEAGPGDTPAPPGRIIPTAEADALRDVARRLDDPFRGLQLGPIGQYRTCDLCGGKFESRGLKLCPDCYEIRKAEAGFADDRRWSSAAGRVTLKRRDCLWCGSPIPTFTESGHKTRQTAEFCMPNHRLRWYRADDAARAERRALLAHAAAVDETRKWSGHPFPRAAAISVSQSAASGTVAAS
jgi:hypothetical protein